MRLQSFWRLCLFVTCVLAANAVCSSEVFAQRPTVASINSYASQVDKFAKPRRDRLFANVVSETEEEDNWREFKNAKELEKSEVSYDEQANVWLKAGKALLAKFTLTSASGDWVQYLSYYFRDDGTLAKIHSQLNTFHGNVSVIKEKYFDTGGKVLRNTTRILDLKTRKPTKARDFMDQEITLYRRAQDLPFYTLL